MDEVRVVDLNAREVFDCHVRGRWTMGEIKLYQR